MSLGISFTAPAGFDPDDNSPPGYSPPGPGGVQSTTDIGGGDSSNSPDDDPNGIPSDGNDGEGQDTNTTTDHTGNSFAGEPINVPSGNMFYHRTDYRTSGLNRLTFTRYYNSRGSFSGFLGLNWRSTYDRYIWIFSASSVLAQRADGQGIPFTLVNGAWTADSDCDYTLVQSGTLWTLTDPNDTVETYENAGGNDYGAPNGAQALLTSLKAKNGYTRTLSYDSNGYPTAVTDSYGRSITFTYGNNDHNHLLTSITTPDNTIDYGYTAISAGFNLTTVTYPTSPSTKVTYSYNNAALPFTLTGATDESGAAFLAWTYDAYGRALTSGVGTGSNANTTKVSYNDTTGARSVTNPLGVIDTYSYITLANAQKVTSISRAATSTTAAAVRSFTYDARGYIASKTDWNGNKTTYVNNSHGRPTTIVAASGTSAAQTTTVSYDITWQHLPHAVSTPGLTVSFTYDGDGEKLSQTLTDTTTTTAPYSTQGQVRTTEYTWSDSLLASVTTPDGHKTSYAYDGTGALTSITDALKHVTNIPAHTEGGLPTTIVDPNGVTTTLTYDPRQRLLSSSTKTSAGARTTSYTYYSNSDVTTTLPDGSFISSLHDTAHRLIAYADYYNNQIDWTLDANGDSLAHTMFNPSGTATFYRTATFDGLGRQLKDTSAVTGKSTQYSYDKNGNALTVSDPLSHTTTRTFDSLNRLITSFDANNGQSGLTYDSHSRILTATAPNNTSTSYVYDGFGDVIQQSSSDSGTTVYRYDADGNITSKTDAAGIVTNHSYDALDRLLTTSYPADSTLNVTLVYDQTGTGFTFGIGRLTSVTDSAGTLVRAYDEQGNLLSEKRTHGSTVLTTGYSYDSANRIASITYPSGAVSSYSRDKTGNVIQMPFKATNSDQSYSLWNVAHLPYGPISAINYNNGDIANFSYDQDYRIGTLLYETYQSTPYFKWTYAYDADNDISAVTDGIVSANSQAFTYDILNRLIKATSSGTFGSLSWGYDNNGNITGRGAGSTTYTNTYSNGTNRIATSTWTGNSQTFGYTLMGNISTITQNGSNVMSATYSKANRLASVIGPPLAISANVYDWQGRRFSKANPGYTPTLFVYDQSGDLIEENDNGTVTDYLYVDGKNIANWKPSQKHLYAINFDHRGVPLVSRDEYGLTNWSAFSQPYGAMTITQSSGQFTGPVTENLRLPGQYFDAETAFHYNGARDYMPGLGRYLEADPAGLAGGANPYLYARGNPLSFSDASGLDPDDLDTPIDLTSTFTEFGQEVSQTFGNSADNPSWLSTAATAFACGPTLQCDGWDYARWGVISALTGGWLLNGAGASAAFAESGTGQAFAGHGFESSLFGTTVVPEGTTIMIPGQAGQSLSQSVGLSMEAGDMLATSALEGSTTYLPGAQIPNLLLRPISDLPTLPNSITVSTDTMLSQLLRSGMGNVCWAACRLSPVP